MVRNVNTYMDGSSPLEGGTSNGLDWWKVFPVKASEYPLKSMGIRILSIIPLCG